MQLLSNVDFDPLCSSGLYVVNGQTAQPSSAMVWNPCLNPLSHNDCCSNCFKVLWPGLTVNDPDHCHTVTPWDSPETLYLTSFNSNYYQAPYYTCAWSNASASVTYPKPWLYGSVPAKLFVTFTYSIIVGGSFVNITYQASYTCANFACNGGTFLFSSRATPIGGYFDPGCLTATPVDPPSIVVQGCSCVVPSSSSSS